MLARIEIGSAQAHSHSYTDTSNPTKNEKGTRHKGAPYVMPSSVISSFADSSPNAPQQPVMPGRPHFQVEQCNQTIQEASIFLPEM